MLIDSVERYIQNRKCLIQCRQKHFKQICHTCRKYAKCKVYAEYVDAWMGLQKSVKEQPTRVVNIKKEGCDVYIGRGSIWGNPFTIGKDGSREDVITKYIDWLLKQKDLLQKIPALRGKRLGCWCKPKDCHGDVLIQCIELQIEQELDQPIQENN